MKKTKSRRIRGWARFHLIIGILAAIAAGVACALRYMVSEKCIKLMIDKFSVKPAQDMIDKVQSYCKDEYIMIALIAAAALIVWAIILFIAAGVSAKKAAKRAAKLEVVVEEVVEEAPATEEVVCVECEDEKESGCPVCGWSLEDLKKKKDELIAKINAKIPEKADKEGLKKIAKVVLPATAACIMTATVVSNVKHKIKAKRRRQFYQWMG